MSEERQLRGQVREERLHHQAREERLRLFLALELPEDVRTALAGWRAKALRGVSGLRPIAPEYLHATLCFLGWQAAGEVTPILRACAVLASSPAPRLCLADAIWLPPRRPRVLAVELGDPDGALAALQAAASNGLAARGWYTPEKRPYLGHVTVVRVGRGERAPRAALGPPPALAFRADRVTLYRSRLSPAGARYEALETIELASA